MEGDHGGTGATVCVTWASGFIGSWLVMRLPERGHYVGATVRDPGNMKKVKHFVDLPKANTHLSMWKAELVEEGSFDDAIEGCSGVFHVATPMEIASAKDPLIDHPTPLNLCNDMIKPTVNGVLNVMRSCSKAKTVKRLIYTSTTGTVNVQPPPPPLEYDESCWTDIDFCKAQKMTGWTYFVAKTLAEKAAWDFSKENGLDLVTIQPSFVIGPFLTPSMPASIEISLALITGNEALCSMLTRARAVHLDDTCNAHIYLFEHPQAMGRYICSSHCFTIYDLAKSLSRKFPEYNIPTKFKGVDESLKAVPCTSKKLLDLGFKFKYNSSEHDVGDLCAEAIESCKEKGLMPASS